MSRLQKKCFIGATSMHCLLLLALIVGPGFFNRRDPVDDAPLIEVIAMPTDGPTRGGAPRPPENPPARQPEVVQPPQPAPPPVEKEERAEKIEKVEKVEPKKVEPEKTTRVDPDAPVVPKNKTKQANQINVSDTRVRIPRTSTTPKNNSTSANSASRANTELARAISNTGKRVSSGLSSTTQVDLPEGPGGGGVSYANYGQIVRAKYTDAWRVPDDMSDDEASIKVSVTIARDGTVLSSRITQSSGSAAADRSIQYTLDRIRSIGVAFPAGAKESERTFILTFNLKAKKAFG